MSSDRRKRVRRPARRAATRSPKRRLLLVCEGRVTEPEYFRGFERWVRNSTVELDFAMLEAGVPDATRRAKRLDQDAEEEDEPGRSPTTGVYRLADSIARPE